MGDGQAKDVSYGRVPQGLLGDGGKVLLTVCDAECPLRALHCAEAGPASDLELLSLTNPAGPLAPGIPASGFQVSSHPCGLLRVSWGSQLWPSTFREVLYPPSRLLSLSPGFLRWDQM